jgi:hypothetical protein
MQLQTLIQQFDIKLCWKHPENDMFLWAQEYEQHLGPGRSGLGDLTQPCEPRPGETCLACGRQWPRMDLN